MLGPTQRLLAYYFGGGFVILLGWAACQPNHRLDTTATRRYLRWSTIAALMGLLHPAITLAARDIVDQAGNDLPDDNLATQHARTRTTINVLTGLSALPVAALLLIHLT